MANSVDGCAIFKEMAARLFSPDFDRYILCFRKS